MYDVFLSYSRADLDIANHIYEKLSKRGLSVFFDKVSINSESFPKKIASGIKDSKIFLFLASRNSVASNYAPDELTYAKNNKPRNSIIVYRIDTCVFPDDIEFLISSLNHRDAMSDSVEVILDDILQLLAQGRISRIPQVTKSVKIDNSINDLLELYRNLEYYSIIYYENENGKWKENWNHHLLMMMTYKRIGDRHNYGILLNLYQTSGISYYPEFYNVVSQIWDMIEFGFIDEAKTHFNNMPTQRLSPINQICLQVNYAHLLLFSGDFQNALNKYREISFSLTSESIYTYLFKDFNTLNWIGYNQLRVNNMSFICQQFEYQLKSFNTTIAGHLACRDYEQLLSSHRWYYKEDSIHINLSFKVFNGVGNSIYYLFIYKKNLIGKLFPYLPFGLDESERIDKSSKIFSQFRLTKKGSSLFIEEFNPKTEVISCGEIVRLNNKELHIKILDNGDPSSKGKIRKYQALD